MTLLNRITAIATGAVLAAAGAATAEEAPIKIGMPVFLSGAAAGPFGLPEKNAA